MTIHANDEKVFLVEHTKIGNDLLNLIHKEVQVTGKIRERFDGKTSIGIKSYKAANIEPLEKETCRGHHESTRQIYQSL